VPEWGSLGSVRGALSNERPSRERGEIGAQGQGVLFCVVTGFQSLPTRRALDCQPRRQRITLAIFFLDWKTQAVFVA
jgi:hypothetical protein